jgi:hypothetical protein
MTHVIRILGYGSDIASRAGRYVSSFDPDFADGRGHVGVSSDPADALRFPDAAAAWECWRTQSTVQPLRMDGKPNRPMTAYTVTIEPLEPTGGT